MNKSFEVTVLSDPEGPITLGTMPEDTVTYNRYNKGLLIAAGRLAHSDGQQSMYMKFATQFKNTAAFRFRNSEKTYYGDFCFINFDPETFTVVFGSVGPVSEHNTEEDIEREEAGLPLAMFPNDNEEPTDEAEEIEEQVVQDESLEA